MRKTPPPRREKRDPSPRPRNVEASGRGQSVSKVEINGATFGEVEQAFFDNVLRAVLKKREFVKKGLVPLEEAIMAMDQYETTGYQPRTGIPCETLDPSMRWMTSIVTNTAMVFDEQEDEDVLTATTIALDSRRLESLSHGSDPDEVRPMEAAVRAVWGETPFYWLQYQLLMAEMQMRFDKDHCFDFEEINWITWIKDRFKFWAGDAEDGKKDLHNEAFQAYYGEQTQGAKDALLDVISEPFEMMDDIVNKWFMDFDDPVSCYTYLSFLGQDWLFTGVSLFIQVMVPLVLGLSSLNDLRDRIRCDQEGHDDLEAMERCDDPGIFHEDSTIACTQRAEAFYGRTMLVGVLLYYAVTVVPEQYSRFCNIFGDSEDTISRLNSLRKYVYDQDEDGLISAKIGYRLDMSMNTTYHCLLYLLTLFMLYTYNDPVEIILNSLAIEFIKDIDEAITKSDSYDQDYRLLKAGAVEMVLRRYLNLHDLQSRLAIFSKEAPPATTAASGGGGGKEESLGRRQGGFEERRKTDGVLMRSNITRAELIRNTEVDFTVDGIADQPAVEEALLYTRQPKQHQYPVYTWLERSKMRRNRTQNPETRAVYHEKFGDGAAVSDGGRASDWVLYAVRFLLPLATGDAIFDKFQRYRDSKLEERWKDLIYGRQPWLSLAKTEQRLARVRAVDSEDQWQELLATAKAALKEAKVAANNGDGNGDGNGGDDFSGGGGGGGVDNGGDADGDAEDLRLLQELRAKSTYKEKTVSHLASEVRRALFFTDLPGHVATAFNAEFPLSERIGRIIFFVTAAAFNSASVVIQIAFPFVFLVAIFYLPMCY